MTSHSDQVLGRKKRRSEKVIRGLATQECRDCLMSDPGSSHISTRGEMAVGGSTCQSSRGSGATLLDAAATSIELERTGIKFGPESTPAPELPPVQVPTEIERQRETVAAVSPSLERLLRRLGLVSQGEQAATATVESVRAGLQRALDLACSLDAELEDSGATCGGTLAAFTGHRKPSAPASQVANRAESKRKCPASPGRIIREKRLGQ
jgi:hypothetical protein